MSGSMLLYLLMAVMTLIAALGLARPWWTRRAGGASQRRASNVAAYRDRLVEIDNEAAAGLISADAAQPLRDEAGARLLDDVDGTEAASEAAAETAAPAAPMRRASAILLVLLALFAGGYYYAQGSWQLQRLVSGEDKQQPMTSADMQQMVETLAQRLESAPDDVEGWAMLGRSYFVLQRYDEAARAYAQVNRISDNQNPDALTSEGEALALAGNRELAGRPRELFEKALAIDPGHAKSLWYAGLAADQAGDAAVARQHWTLLLEQPLPDELRTLIAERMAALGGAPAAAAPPALAAAPAGASAQATPSTVSLQVRLSLAPELRERVPKDAVLMLYARAEQGPPMPVAVNRGAAPAFPAELSLDDSMAVMPTMKLSQFDSWVVTARLSRSGQAKAESGDLQGSRVVTRAEAGAPLSLTIDQLVP